MVQFLTASAASSRPGATLGDRLPWGEGPVLGFWVRTAVVFLGLFAGFAGQATSPRIQVDAGQIFRDVEKLAADDMEGRLIGTPGGQRAREYVLARFKQAGVAPAGDRFERPFTFASS